ncbi:hypothetical protein ACVGXY_00210, partial [Enterobacter intestinihominis]
VSFYKFEKIGIVAGAIKAHNDKNGNLVTPFGMRLVYGATLVSLLTPSNPALELRSNPGCRFASH